MRTKIMGALLGLAIVGPSWAGWTGTGAAVSGTVKVKNEGKLTMEVDRTEAHGDPATKGKLISGRVVSNTGTMMAVGVTPVAGFKAEWMAGEKEADSWGLKVTRLSDMGEAWLTFGSDQAHDAKEDYVKCGDAKGAGVHLTTEINYSIACWTKEPMYNIDFHVGIGSQAGEHQTPVGAYKLAVTGATINV